MLAEGLIVVDAERSWADQAVRELLGAARRELLHSRGRSTRPRRSERLRQNDPARMSRRTSLDRWRARSPGRSARATPAPRRPLLHAGRNRALARANRWLGAA